jgi:hypothetical protein
MKERREFIRCMAVAASVVAARPVLLAVNVGSAQRGDRMHHAADFERWIGSSFRVSGADNSAQSLVLDQVLTVDGGGRVENFSLRFQGRADAKLPERLYRFSHREAGTFDCFITPGTTEGDRCSYRAVFCRLVG